MAQTDPGTKPRHRDDKAERGRYAGAADLEALVPADNTVEDLRSRFLGVGAIEEMGEIGTVHDVLSSFRRIVPSL
jgi:hypothetical protein